MASPSPALSGLPASRTDALSMVVIALAGAFTGSTPAKDKTKAIIISTIGNAWGALSAVLTLYEIIHSPDDIEKHLWFFMVGMYILTIVTSTLTLVSFVVDRDSSCMWYAFIGGLVVVLVAFLFGLATLLLTYAKGCNEPSFADTAICEHSTGYVVGVVVGMCVCGILCGGLIAFSSVGSASGVCQSVWTAITSGDEPEPADIQHHREPYSIPGAAATRTSALVKACLFAIYWFLVDPDLTWDFTINGHDMSLWVTGQWAKQGAAIANHWFNEMG